jgi:hypothetical protein
MPTELAIMLMRPIGARTKSQWTHEGVIPSGPIHGSTSRYSPTIPRYGACLANGDVDLDSLHSVWNIAVRKLPWVFGQSCLSSSVSISRSSRLMFTGLGRIRSAILLARSRCFSERSPVSMIVGGFA